MKTVYVKGTQRIPGTWRLAAVLRGFYASLPSKIMYQAVSYIMLVVVGVFVVGPLAIYAQGSITANVMSYHDFAELERIRVSQHVSITHVQHDDANKEIHVHIVNTGLEDITFEYILLDGEILDQPSTADPCWVVGGAVMNVKEYCYYDVTGADIKSAALPVAGQTRLGINYDTFMSSAPTTIQLVTDAFKLFEITVP